MVAMSLNPHLLLGPGEKKRVRGWTRTTMQKIWTSWSPCPSSLAAIRRQRMRGV